MCFRCPVFKFRHKRALDAVETASAEHGGHNRARSLSVAEPHVTAAYVAVNRHFRDERDTHTRRNHSQQTAELAAFEGNVRSNAGVHAGSDAEIAETVSVAQHDERFSAEIFKSERFCGRAWIVSFQHREQRLGADGEQLQILVAQWKSKNRDINGQVTQTFYQDRRRFFDDA